MLAAAPDFPMGGADGFYKPTSVESSVRFAGRNYKLPLKALRKVLLEKGDRYGLENMKSRLVGIGGSCYFHASATGGAEVEMRVPVR